METNLERTTTEIVKTATGLIIKSVESCNQANALLISIKGIRSQVLSVFDPMINKAHAAHKEAINQKKKFTDPLDEAERVTKRSISQYMAELERVRAAEREAQLEKERLEKEAREKEMRDAIEVGDDDKAASILMAPLPLPDEYKQPSYIEKPSVKTRKMLKWKVVNQSEIKAEYMIPNDAVINKMVSAFKKDAEKTVGGIEVYEETIIVN